MIAVRTRIAALIFCSAGSLFAMRGALVWGDEFDQPENSAPDSSRWTFDLGGGGWGNNELETYTSSRANSFIAADPAATDGHALAIRAVRAASGLYTSARLKSLGHFSARGGRIEARIKVAGGQGLWNAFWLLGDSIGAVGWPACGEIDVMEILNARPAAVHGTLHGPGYSGSHGIGAAHRLADGRSFDAGYHVFAIDWTPDRIEWSVDGTTYHTVTSASLPAGAKWVFADHGFHLLLNLAVGGYWPGNPDAATVFPAAMMIDYVRVYAPAAAN